MNKHFARITMLVASAFAFAGGCVTTKDDVVISTTLVRHGAFSRPGTFPLPAPNKVEAIPITPKLELSGGLTFSSEGVLYFANHLQPGTIGRYVVGESADPETFIDLRKWMTPYGERIPRAHGLCIDREGWIIGADAGTGKVIRISPNADKVEVLADSFEGLLFTSTRDVAIGPEGDVFASSPEAGVIYRIRPSDGFVGILNEDLVRVEELAISPDGRCLVGAEPDAIRVVVFDLDGGDEPVASRTLVDFASSGQEPFGLAFDEAGRLYVGLGSEGRIKVFDFTKSTLLQTYDAGGPAQSLTYRDGSLYVSGGATGVRRLSLNQP